MSHQAHNLPWHIWTKHFKLKKCLCKRGCDGTNHSVSIYPLRNCPIYHLVECDKPQQIDQIKHFWRCLIRTIREFADTERKKYPVKVPLRRDALFCQEFYDGYKARYLRDSARWDGFAGLVKFHLDVQHEKAWTALRCPVSEWSSTFTGLERFAKCEAIKVLIDGEDISNLLAMAQDPCGRSILHETGHDGQSHPQGWDAVPEAAFTAYLIVNLAALFPEIGRIEYPLRSMQGLESACLDTRDHNVQNIPHWDAWSKFTCDDRRNLHRYDISLYNEPDARKAYMKKCFRLMYCVDMIAREAEYPLNWEYIMQNSMQSLRLLHYSKWPPGALLYEEMTSDYQGSGKRGGS